MSNQATARDYELSPVKFSRLTRRGGPHPEDPESARASGVYVVHALADLPATLGVPAPAEAPAPR